MKKIEWINGNKMKFSSLHKTFNKQADCISTGNVIGDVQLSSFIRPYTKTECNGFTNEKGHLQDFDLQMFIEYNVPRYIIEEVRTFTKKVSAIFYVFKHYNRGQRIIDGCVLTTPDYKRYKLIKKWYCQHNAKSMSALDETIKYITV